MPRITTSDSAEIHYTDSGGDGKPILLIGGWCMSTPWWHEQQDALGEQFRLVAMDPRTYGESEKVTYGHRMPRHAADIRDLLGALDLEDVTAVGWSLGANVLLGYYELFGAERISGIVHVDQSPYCLNRGDWVLGFGTVEEAEEFLTLFREDADAGANTLIDLMFVEEPSSEEREWMVEEILKTPTDAALHLEWDHITADWRDMVPTVDLPVLVTTGRQSEIFPWESGEWLAETLPNAEHVVFEESGHCPFLEETERFNEVVADFAG